MQLWLFDPKNEWRARLSELPALVRMGATLAPLGQSHLKGFATCAPSLRDSGLSGVLLLAADRRWSPPDGTPGVDALQILSCVLRCGLPLVTIGLTAREGAGGSLLAMGALAVVTTEAMPEALPRALAEAAELVELRTGHRVEPPPPPEAPALSFLYRSDAMKRLHVRMTELAATHHDIVIVGETGAGKEQVAREIHRIRAGPKGGPGTRRPFVEYNCAQLARDRERQKTMFFGIAGGVFPGVTARDGLLKSAGRGDLFLDEVEFMVPQVQGLLLTALETRHYSIVGQEHAAVPFHCRILLGFKSPLRRLVAARKLREDMYYRLSVAEVRIPRLRDRKDDIPLLAHHFLLTSRYGLLSNGERKVQGIAPETLELLMAQRWRGNVRSLRNVIEAALIQIDHGVGQLKPDHVRDLIAYPAPQQARTAVMAIVSRPGTMRSVGPEGLDLATEVARLKVELLNAAYQQGRTVGSVVKLLGYAGKMALLRERRRLKKKFPDLYAGLVEALRV